MRSIRAIWLKNCLYSLWTFGITKFVIHTFAFTIGEGMKCGNGKKGVSCCWMPICIQNCACHLETSIPWLNVVMLWRARQCANCFHSKRGLFWTSLAKHSCIVVCSHCCPFGKQHGFCSKRSTLLRSNAMFSFSFTTFPFSLAMFSTLGQLQNLSKSRLWLIVEPLHTGCMFLVSKFIYIIEN